MTELGWSAVLADEAATRLLGEEVGRRCREGDVVALCGALGAGKTTFAQGLAKGLDVPADVGVRSPTFALCNEYRGRTEVLHIDLYRVGSAEEAEDLGFRDRVGDRGVAVVEWADRLASLLPGHTLWIELEHDGDRRRAIAWEPDEPVGVQDIVLPPADEEEKWTAVRRTPPWERSPSRSA